MHLHWEQCICKTSYFEKQPSWILNVLYTLTEMWLNEIKYILQIPVAFPVAGLEINPRFQRLFPHEYLDP